MCGLSNAAALDAAGDLLEVSNWKLAFECAPPDWSARCKLESESERNRPQQFFRELFPVDHLPPIPHASNRLFTESC